MLVSKHTIEALEKIKLRFKDKTKHPMHPMYGNNHDSFALLKISKPGKLNHMYGKTQNSLYK